MQQLGFKDRWQLWVATLLIKLGKLTRDTFTSDELTELANQFYPHDLILPTPVGDGHVTLQRGHVYLNDNANRVCLQSLASIAISGLGTTLYRAHLVVIVSASPYYDPATATLHFQDLAVDDIRLINDDYALLQDTRYLINKRLPGSGLANLVAGSVKNMLSLVSVGTSDQALSYLQLYLAGSKQSILDYHRPQIRKELLGMAETLPLHHQMRSDVWREALFARYGKTVVVNSQRLEFRF